MTLYETALKIAAWHSFLANSNRARTATAVGCNDAPASLGYAGNKTWGYSDEACLAGKAYL